MAAVVSIVFFLGLGVLWVFGPQFPLHELFVGIAALLIGLAQLIALLTKK